MAAKGSTGGDRATGPRGPTRRPMGHIATTASSDPQPRVPATMRVMQSVWTIRVWEERAVRVVNLAGVVILVVATAACGDPGATPSTVQATEPTHVASQAHPSPGASASGDLLAVCADVPVEGQPFEIAIETVSYAFDTDVIEGPRACQPFTITFTNNDVDDPQDGITGGHDIDIRADNVLGPLLFDGEEISGPGGTVTYEIPGLPAGEHYFYCSFHAAVMKGALIVTES